MLNFLLAGVLTSAAGIKTKAAENISNGKKVFIFDAVPELFVLLRGPDLNLAKVVKGGGVAQRRRGCGDTSLKMRKSDCLSVCLLASIRCNSQLGCGWCSTGSAR